MDRQNHIILQIIDLAKTGVTFQEFDANAFLSCRVVSLGGGKVYRFDNGVMVSEAFAKALFEDSEFYAKMFHAKPTE